MHLMRDMHIACIEKCENLQRKIREDLDKRFTLFIDTSLDAFQLSSNWSTESMPSQPTSQQALFSKNWQGGRGSNN